MPLFILLSAIALAAGHAGKAAMGMAASVGAMALLLIAISESIKIIGKMDPESIRKSVLAISAVLIEIGVLLAVIGSLNKGSGMQMGQGTGKEVMKTMLGLSIAILAIAAAMRIIGELDWKQAAVAAGALGGVILAFGTACWLASKFQSSMSSLIAMAGVIATISISLLILTLLPIDKLETSAKALGGVIVAVGYALGKLKAMKLREVLGSALLIAEIIGGVAAALWYLSQNDWESVAAAGIGMALAIAAVGYAIKNLNGLQNMNLGKALGIALSVGGILIGIGAALRIVLDSGADWEQIAAASLGLTVAILGIAGAIKAIQTIGVVSPAAVGKFIVAATELIGATTAVLVLLSQINKGTNGAIEEALDFLVMVFEKLGELVGKTIGALVNGAMMAATKNIEEVGTRLSNFAKNVEGFAKLFGSNKTMWSNIVASTGEFANALNNLRKIGNNYTNNTINSEQVTKNLTSLADGLGEFYTKLTAAKVDIGEAKKAAEAIEILTGIVPPDTTGDADAWTKVATGMRGLGEALVAFGNVVSGETGIDFDAVESGFNLIDKLGKIVSNIDTSKFQGWTKLIGLDEMSGTGQFYTEGRFTGLQQMAIALKQFDNLLAGSGENEINVDRLNNAFEAIGALADIAKKIPDAGGMVQTFLGGFKWSTIYKGLVGQYGSPGMAETLVEFANITKDLDMTGLDNGLAALERLTSIDFEPAKAGWVQDIMGDDTMEGFAEATGKLKESLNNFITAFTGYNDKDLDGAFAVLHRIVQIPNSFKAAGIDAFSGGTNTLVNIGLHLEDFATHFANMYTTLAGLTSSDDVEKKTSAITNLIDSLMTMFSEQNIQSIQDAGSKMSEALLRGMNNDSGSGAIDEAILAWVTNVGTKLTTNNEANWNDVGISIARFVADGFKGADAQGEVEGAVNVLIPFMADEIRSYGGLDANSPFYRAGAWLVTGLIEGFNSMKKDAVGAASNLGSAMNRAFMNSTGEKSPSKLWKQYGAYLIDGLTIGMNENTGEALKSVEYLASSLNGEMEGVQPRISPVVDLGNAKYSSRKLSEMFDTTRAQAISASMSIDSQVTKIDDLVDITSKIYRAVEDGTFGGPTVNVYASEGMDVEQIGDAVIDRLNRELVSKNSRWAY